MAITTLNFGTTERWPSGADCFGFALAGRWQFGSRGLGCPLCSCPPTPCP